MMKILYVANIRFPSERAHATQVAHMCQAFSDLGHDVTLVCTDRIDTKEHDAEDTFGFTPSFTIKKIPQGPFPVTNSKVLFHLNRLWFLLSLMFRVSLRQSDVVYTRDEFLAYGLSRYVKNKKIIYESHEAKWNFFARSILKRGVRCVAISTGIKEEYHKKGIQVKQILVAHDGIDESFFGQVASKDEVRKRLGIETEKPVALYIGGFDTWKGVETFFKAASYAREIQFVAIGGKEDEVSYYEGLYPEVQFLGSGPYKDLRDNQQAADVLVVPNTAQNELSSTYTSPLKLFAHLASGVPIVVSDIPSMHDVVSEREATFFEADSPTMLASTIESAIKDKETSLNKAQMAKVLAGHYTWNERAKNIFKFVT